MKIRNPKSAIRNFHSTFGIRRSAFTLVELLVVVGIIGLLIAILLPSLSGARKSAKNGDTKTRLKAIGDGLEMFKNDVGEYPDSAKQLDPTDADYSATSAGEPPGYTHNGTILYGAQALARALVGKDLFGYVDSVRARKQDPSKNPSWYYNCTSGAASYTSPFPRTSPYFKDQDVFLRTNGITEGTFPPAHSAARNNMTQLVLKDAFNHPVLYYRANPLGAPDKKLLCDATADAAGIGGLPLYNPGTHPYFPYYNLLDNDFFTGCKMTDPDWTGTTSGEEGWDFGTQKHLIRELGDPRNPNDVNNPPADRTDRTFAQYIVDPQSLNSVTNLPAEGNKLRPYNPNTYLLITAGSDGVFGTSDDIDNFGQR